MPPTSQPITRHDQIEAADGKPVAQPHVLVTVFLRGGADGLTLVPPVGDDAYYHHRTTLAVSRSKAIKLNDYFGLNPALEPLAAMFHSGDLAVFHGVGSEDQTRSHFEAQDTMEHGGNLGSGWIARYLRARSGAVRALSAVAIGTTQPESLRGAPAGVVMQTIRDFAFNERDDAFVEQLARLYAVDAGPMGTAALTTVDAVRRLRQLRATTDPAGDASYPRTPFARGLNEIARLIRADVGLTATTINLDGWDTHFVQDSVITSRMQELAGGLEAFWNDLGDLRRSVTVVVMTEFGRRLQENTSFGTDHGAGGVMLAIGAGVRELGMGGKMWSGWTNLQEANLDEVGDVPAAINYRDVIGPLLVHNNPSIELSRVFPGYQLKPIA